MAHFYVTLVSNSSMDIFPNNTTSSFTTQLSEKISLKGIWSVAIAEIHYNYNFFNVTNGNNKIILRCGDSKNNDQDSNNLLKKPRTYEVKILEGYYKSVQDLVDTVNLKLTPFVRKNKNLFAIDSINSRTHVFKDDLNEGIDDIMLEGRLGLQLGFQPNHNILLSKSAPHIGNICFGVPDQMIIYTDIVEPSFFGSDKSYVLKIVNTESRQFKFGDACYKEYSHMHYIRVQKREFESISIDIRDHTGKFMPFQHGVLMVKLHFKQENEA